MGIIITTTTNNFQVDFNGIENSRSVSKLQRYKTDCKFDFCETYIKVNVLGEKAYDITNDTSSTDFLIVESINGISMAPPVSLLDLYTALTATQG